jgi:hypothetical protein
MNKEKKIEIMNRLGFSKIEDPQGEYNTMYYIQPKSLFFSIDEDELEKITNEDEFKNFVICRIHNTMKSFNHFVDKKIAEIEKL